MERKSILIVAGEASADMHGSKVVREIFKKDPSIFIYGVGGLEMEKAGVYLLAKSSEMGVTGVFEVFFKLKQLLSVFFLLLKSLRIYKPDLAILIDYPDFNLRLAKRLKKRGIPVLYYISPQVWAWRSSRLRQIKKSVSKMLVVFPFEATFYKAAGIDVDFVGHPLLDHLGSAPTVSEQVKTIALMPGSRKNEIRYLLPPLFQAAREIHKRYPGIQFLLVLAPTLEKSDLIPSFRQDLPIQLTAGGDPNALLSADFVICCSGTATLESAILGKPMVVLYKLNRLTYLLATLLMTSGLRYFSLPNLIRSKRVVPELFQHDVTAEKISKEVFHFLEDRELLRRTSEELLKIRHQLGAKGAASRVAEEVFRFLKSHPEPHVIPRLLRDSSHDVLGMTLLKFGHRFFLPLLWLASCFYRFMIKARRFFYVSRIFKARQVSAMVISVGNITMGGTGKTPFTMFLANEMRRRGRSVAVLSRGYKRKSSKAWDCVSDGESVRLGVSEAGDEPWLMASRLKGIPVYVGANRYQTAVEILKRHPVDMLLLDDGFQHWRLDRNFDFVTFDATTLKEGVRLLPYGKFREPLEHLKRSNCLILTRTDQLNDLEQEKLRRKLHLIHPVAPLIEANYRPQHLLHIPSGQKMSLDHLSGQRVSAFVGIGNPDSFRRSAEAFSQVVDFKVYLDHYFYSAKTIDRLLKGAEKRNVDLVLTTEKDAVRIPREILKSNPPLYALCVDLEITKGGETLSTLLDHLK